MERAHRDELWNLWQTRSSVILPIRQWLMGWIFGFVSGPSGYAKLVAVAGDFCGVSASEVVGQDERVGVCSARKHLVTGSSCLLGILAEAAVPMRLHDLDRTVHHVTDENCPVRAGLEVDDRASRGVSGGGNQAQVLVNRVAAAPQHGLPSLVDRGDAVLVSILIDQRAQRLFVVERIPKI